MALTAQSWGIDISNYQTTRAAQHPDAQFVIVLVSDGINFVNKRWKEQASAAWHAGKKVGLYHFARPNKSLAVDAADKFLAEIASAGWIGYALPVLDFEENATLNRTDWAYQWLNRVWEKTPSRPLFYTYAYALDKGNHAVIAKYYPLWCAGYAGKPWDSPFPYKAAADRWGYRVAMWQYASNRDNWYGGDLDKNTGYFPLSNWDDAVLRRGWLDALAPLAADGQPRLAVDGDWGALTGARYRQVMGRPADEPWSAGGLQALTRHMSWAVDTHRLQAAGVSTGRVDHDRPEEETVRAFQTWWNNSAIPEGERVAINGLWDTSTVKAMQHSLNYSWAGALALACRV